VICSFCSVSLAVTSTHHKVHNVTLNILKVGLGGLAYGTDQQIYVGFSHKQKQIQIS
jgi:hypothetical protein